SLASVTEGSVDYPDYIPVGNKAQFDFSVDGENLRLTREMPFPVESDGSTYWFSFFMNTTIPDAQNNIGNLTFVNTGIADRGGRLLGVGRIFGQKRLGSIVIRNGANNSRTTDLDDDGLHWLVGRIQTSAEADGVDTFSLWIDPALDVEPDTADASHYQYFQTPAFQLGFDAIQLRTEGVNGNETPYRTEFDELRFARAWPSARATVNTIEPVAEDQFALAVSPNPAHSELTISYDLERAGKVNVDLYNLNGQLVSRLFSVNRPAGEQRTTLDIGSDRSLSNGIYLLQVTQGSKRTTRKLILYR
ncbi:MAG: T9SS type A sorting domain-containing protein, partial [Bacteroidota bacterium]